jgi:hypothetical protein
MDDAGNAIAVWVKHDGTQYSLFARGYVSGSGWDTSGPQLIESDDSRTQAMDVTMNDAGDAIAIWWQYNSTQNNIWVRHYVVGSGWQGAGPELIGTYDDYTITDPHVVMDEAGNAIAVWRQRDGTRDDICARRYVAGSGWQGSGPELIGTNHGNVGNANVAMDGVGNAVAAWWQHDGTRDNIWARRYVVGSGWQGAGPELIELDEGDTGTPLVAMDRAGNAVVIWRQSDGAAHNLWANEYR